MAAHPAARLARTAKPKERRKHSPVRQRTGAALAALLDSERPEASGAGTHLSPRDLPCRARSAGRYMAGEDFAVTAGWGHFGVGDAVMPGRGRIVERRLSTEGDSKRWRNTWPRLVRRPSMCTSTGRPSGATSPAAIWDYRLGGYQVLKKWLLSYRERTGYSSRKLRAEEVQHFTDTRMANWRATAGDGQRTRREFRMTAKLIDRSPDIPGWEGPVSGVHPSPAMRSSSRVRSRAMSCRSSRLNLLAHRRTTGVP